MIQEIFGFRRKEPLIQARVLMSDFLYDRGQILIFRVLNLVS